MQITSRFTIAIHSIMLIEYNKSIKVTSGLIAGSVNVNPVIIRGVLSRLKEAGIINSRQGASGFSLAKRLDEITFYDVYTAVDSVKDDGIFHFHEHPNPDCPVGRNIHFALDNRLAEIQSAMETEMKQITLADVADDMLKKIEGEKDAGVCI